MGEYQKTIYPGIFKYIGRNGTVYGVNYYAGGKKHREIVGALLGDAKKKLEERRNQGKRGVVVRKRVTFRELAKEYVRLHGDKPSYDRSQKYFIGYWDEKNEWKDMSLTQHFGGYKIIQIGPRDIEEFRSQRKDTPVKGNWDRKKKVRVEKKRSETSVNRELEILRHMLNKAIEWGWIDETPFNRFKESVFFDERNDRVRFLNEDEIKKLLGVSPPYLQDIIAGAIFTGLRKGDLLGLKWSDVDLDRGVLTFREQKKRNKVTTKYLNGDMISLLTGIPRGTSEFIFNGPVSRPKGSKQKYIAFPDPNGKPVKSVSKSFRTALKRVGIQDFHFHDLRHTSASHLLMRGASMKAVQEHLTHSSPAMTNRYAHISEKFQREQIELLNGLCGESSKKLVRNDQKANTKEGPDIHATA